MTEKRPLRLPSWVVLAAVVAGVVVMVPASILVYVRDGYTDRGAMQVMGLMLMPMIPFAVLSFWKGLDMPDSHPPITEDRSRELVVGERPTRLLGDLSPEGASLIASGIAVASAVGLAYCGALLYALAAFAVCLGGVAFSAVSHIRRVNRSDDD